MTQYITTKKLEESLKAMAILDMVMEEKDDAWLRLVNAQKMDNGYLYNISDGCGDELHVLITSSGTLIKGFDHENELNQYAADEWDAEFFEHTFANVPTELLDVFDEEERDSTTFCMWCMDETDMWMQNETQDNDGGKEYLLGYICRNATDWCEWASDYYEEEIQEEIVEKVYRGESLTEEEIKGMNSERDAEEVMEEIVEIFGA